jgi:hypothetical protein
VLLIAMFAAGDLSMKTLDQGTQSRHEGLEPVGKGRYRPVRGLIPIANSGSTHCPLIRTTSVPTGVLPFCLSTRNPMSLPEMTAGACD